MDNSLGVAARLTDALACAGHGWRVLPVKGKIPLLKDWPTLATTDEATIRRWWTQDPDANIGLATGKASDLFVLDVDPAKGGDESLRSLEKMFGALPQTVEVLTGGGGRHCYFTHPGVQVGNSAGALGPGLDIRSDGGQVVAPPSVHPTTGRTYEWDAGHHPDDVGLAAVPPWVLRRLTVAKGAGAPFVSPERICDGLRNETLYKTGRSMKAKGVSRAAIRAALLAENRAKCEPPVPDGEVEQIVESAWSQADRADFKPPPPVDSAPPFVSAPKNDPPRESNFSPLHVTDFLDVRQEEDKIEWVLEDYLPEGGLVLLAGKPKEGKTTLIYELAVKVAKGLPFLNRVTRPAGVLILGLEEHPRDMRLRLRSLGADDTHTNLFVVSGNLSPTADTFDQVTRYILEKHIKLVVVDTLGVFWNVRDENDAAEVQRAIKPFLTLARESGACVLLIHHARKSEGQHGDEIRGSGALFAAVDVALILKRHEIQTQRKLNANSRYPETPTEMILELTETGYALLGDPAHLTRQVKREKMKAALKEDSEQAKVLAQRAGVSLRDAQRLLDDLAGSDPEVERTGKGRKGDPYQYRKHSIHATPSVLGGPLRESNSVQTGFDSCSPPSPCANRNTLYEGEVIDVD